MSYLNNNNTEFYTVTSAYSLRLEKLQFFLKK